MSMLIYSLDTPAALPIYYERDHIGILNTAAAMRITTEAKSATRERILAASAKLFAKNGWDGATTRDIAVASGIATGTLFNYFQSKESVAAALMAEAFTKAREEFETQRDDRQSLEEDLFSFVYAGLKKLRKFRKVLASAAETIFSPLARSSRECAGDAIRVQHLEQVEQLLAAHRVPGPLPAVTMQLYWTLYLGVFAYWAADDSPNQEDTLALLDHSLKLFIGSLEIRSGPEGERNHERETE
jgi:AcrR family transcriptional regulator